MKRIQKNRYAVQGKYAPVSGLWDDEWYVIEETWDGRQIIDTRICGQYATKEAAENAAEKK